MLVCSGFVTVKEDGTETTEDIQDVVSLQPNAKNEGRDVINDSVTVKVEALEIKDVNTINEVGFKKVFKFVGFKFTLKKDTCEQTEEEEPLANIQEEKVAGTSEDSRENDGKENTVPANIDTPDELLKSEETGQPEAAEPPHKTENEKQLDQSTGMVEHNVEITPDEEAKMVESDEPMSPFKQFFTQGIFSSLRKKRKEEIQREIKEEELIDQIEDAETSERAEKVDTKCMCLDIPYIMHEEDKDSKPKPEEELQHSVEKEMVQASPLKRLFRKFSSRRQRESTATENVVEDGDKVTEQLESSLELTEIQTAEEPVVVEPKSAVEEQLADASPQGSKKKSDSSVSWEALICGSSAKKRARKTTAEGETADNEKTTESPLGSSIEGDYDHLTSSNEQDGEGESESTWKAFKKMVTPKRKVRTGDSSSSEHIPSDSETNKDDSFSMKKLIAERKKKKSDGRQEQTSSDETGKDADTGDEDDETPAIIPLSEYEIIEPESVKEVHEEQVEITIEHEMPKENSQVLEQDAPNESQPKLEDKVSNNAGPLIIRVLSEDFEEVTDFISKYQQLSDIPEEGIIEESVETPISSAEWTTQDDTLAEDFVDLTADAVTAPEPESEEFFEDNSTEMVSALSQLTESARTSGPVTPESAEYGVQVSNVILQEAVQSIGITPSVQSVTTKDEVQESLAVSFSQSTIPEETRVLVAHMKSEVTAICTGLISQEIESVEDFFSAPLVETIPEVSDAVPTELVYDDLTDAPDKARLGTDEVYEAEVWEVKTQCQEVIITNEEAVTETEIDVEQVIQQLTEPLMEAHVSHVVDQKDENVTHLINGIQLGSVKMAVIDKMQSEAVLDQVIPENTYTTETEGPLHLLLKEQPVCFTEVAAEGEKDFTELEDKVPLEKVELIHVDQLQEDIKDANSKRAEAKADSVLELVSADDLVGTVEDTGEKNEETGVEMKIQHEIRDVPADQSKDVVALKIDQNNEIELILKTADESLSREEFVENQLDIASEDVSLPEKVSVDKVTAELGVSPKEMDTDLNNIRVEESASKAADSINTTEKENKLLFTKTESGESGNYEVSEIAEQDVVTNNVDTAHAITVTDVSEISNDVLEPKEITTDPGARSKVILTDVESVISQNEAREVETEELSQDLEHSSGTFKNEQQFTEKVKSGEVLEMVAIIENTTNQSEKEEPVHALTISEIKEQEEEETSTTEISVEAIGAEQKNQATVENVTEKETPIPETKDKVSNDSELELESPQPTEIEVTVTAVSEAQNNAAIQMENNSETEQKDDATEETMLKCESPELLEKPLAVELQVEKTESKDEVPSVIYPKEDASAVTTPEVAPMIQVPLLTSITEAESPEVAVSEIQTQEPVELRAATLEVKEPNVEMAVVAEVKVETAAVTELCVDKLVVRSVVSELEVDIPVVTFITETIDTRDSAVTSLNQNTENDTSKLVQNQEVVVPTVTPAALDLVTPAVTLDSKSVVVAPVEDTSVKNLVVDEPPIDLVVDPVEELQNVSVIEGAPTAEVTVTGTIAETIASVSEPVLEPPAVSVTTVKPTESVSPVLEMPNVALEVKTPTVVQALEAPVVAGIETQAVVLVTDTEPPVVVTPAETQVAKTSVVSPVVETPVISITSEITTVTAMAQALVVTPVDEASALVPETVTEAVDPLAGTLFESPEVKTSAVMPTALAKPVEETPAQDSITVTHSASPVVTPEGADTSIASPEVNLIEADLTPVVQTPALVSVIVKQAPHPVTPPVTAVVEISSVQTPSNLAVMVDTAVMFPEVTTLPAISEETVTSPVRTPVHLMETSTVIPALLQVTPEVERHAVAPDFVTSAIASMVVTLDVMPGIQDVEAKDDVKPPPMTETEVMTSVLPECISTEGNAKGSLQQVPTSTESQSEVEDDVWEDAIDSIGDSLCQMMETDVLPQDSAVKQESNAAD